MKKLIAGPWVGEFGWELFAWQGYIRSLSKHFDHTTVISRRTSKALYEDFADNFIAHQPHGTIVDSFFMHGVDLSKDIKKIIMNHQIKLDSNTSLVLPRRIGIPPHTHYTEAIKFGAHNIQPEYKIFGSQQDIDVDYVFHIRNRKSVRPKDNWSIDNWIKLRNLLGDDKKIACVGTKAESGWIENTTDMRDIELQSLFNLLYNCKCVFGPSSGPMHLASLCKTKHIVWGSRKLSLDRYETTWNPHQTPVVFADKHGWHPPPEYIYENFRNWT
jgi:hypothetical protein